MIEQPGFWDRLGLDEAGMPIHLPMGVTEDGRGPTNDAEAHHFVCWCGHSDCPLTKMLARIQRRVTEQAWDEGFTHARFHHDCELIGEPDDNPYRSEAKHSPGCHAWTDAAPGQRGCVCRVSEGVPDDY